MFKKLVLIVLIVSACSTSTIDSDPSEASQSNTATASSTPSTTRDSSQTATTTAPTLPAEPDPISDNATVFVATLEEIVIDTPFSGAVLDSPEVFLAAGEIMCARLDAGDSVDEILIDYLNGFNEPTTEITEEDVIVLAGGVLGASVELFCPQHIGLIGETS